MIQSIFAVDANGGLGKDGTLPWPKDPEDLQWFKTNTIDSIVVMGKNTWLDPMMPKPLPRRISVVAASNDFQKSEKAHWIISGNDLAAELRDVQLRYPGKALWIIGGARLLQSSIHLVEKIYLTRFDHSYDCDVTIHIDECLKNFKLIKEIPGEGKRFQIYEKLS